MGSAIKNVNPNEWVWCSVAWHEVKCLVCCVVLGGLGTAFASSRVSCFLMFHKLLCYLSRDCFCWHAHCHFIHFSHPSTFVCVNVEGEFQPEIQPDFVRLKSNGMNITFQIMKILRSKCKHCCYAVISFNSLNSTWRFAFGTFATIIFPYKRPSNIFPERRSWPFEFKHGWQWRLRSPMLSVMEAGRSLLFCSAGL